MTKFQGPPRHLGMFLWVSYQVVNVVIMMNLLIALMNATIAGIQEDKITEWRFARTQVIFMTCFLLKSCNLSDLENVL